MSEQPAADSPSRRRQAAPPAPGEEQVSLRPYVETIWRYRNVIWIASAGVALFFLVGVLALAAVSPTEHVSSVQFRILFDGAAENRYPNGMPFSSAEIVGAPVVSEVFKANELQRFGTYDDFKRSLFIQQSNPALDLLNLEYQARLSDMKLTPVDRARFEDEFRRKRQALTDPSFALRLRRTERFRVLPKALAEKVLTDTLATWARQAEMQKGAFKYQVPILSASILSRESLERDDYLVAADMLRAKAARVLRTIEKLEEIPGALTIRSAKDRVSLSEIRTGLEDCIRFDLEPLLGFIRSVGITKNPRLLSLYAKNMVFQLRLDKQETEARAKALQSAMREYVSQTGSPGSLEVRANGSGAPARPGASDGPSVQLNDSFLARLQEMSAFTQKDEMEYRRKLTDQIITETWEVATFDKELNYYEDLARSLEGLGTRETGSADLVAMVKARSSKAFDTIEKAITQLSDLYQELSTQNLDPAARLFVITGPFTQQSRPSLSFGSVWLSFVLAMLLTLILAPIGCLVYDARRAKGAQGT